MSVGFFFLMNATNIIQNIIPVVMQDNGMGKLGYYSSGLMFCVFAIAAFFTAPQVTYLGDRWSMVIGSITYCFLTAT
jgi:MFS family permease